MLDLVRIREEGHPWWRCPETEPDRRDDAEDRQDPQRAIDERGCGRTLGDSHRATITARVEVPMWGRLQ